jgi:hypothetical protein
VLAVFAGLALGVFVARRRKLFAPAALPFASLLKTLRPLILPLFAVAIVGLLQRPLWVPVLATAALTLIAVRLILMPEVPKSETAERWERGLLRRVGKHTAFLAGILALLAGVLAWVLSTRYFDSIGGITAFLLVLALLLWGIAFLLRFVSYASSWLRALVALFVVLTGLRLGAAIGLLPWGSWLSAHAPWLDLALPVLAATLLALEAALDVVARWRDRRVEHGWKPPSSLDALLAIRSTALRPEAVQITQALGVSTALLATLVLAVSATVGLIQTAQPGETLSVESATPASEEPAPGAPGRFADDLALAKAYTPVLAFTHDERWSPIAVDSYAGEAVLSGPLKEPPANPRSAREKLDRTCPRLATSPCYRLSIRCKDGHEPCGMGAPHPDRNSDRLYPEGDVYVRVVKRSAEEAEERKRETEHLRPSDRWPPRVFLDEGPYRKSLTTLLQYWYFYRYDEWEARVFAGRLVQRHEGDWEAVTIGLSDQKPLFVAYSAHCAGTWKPWDAIELSDKFPEPTHPLVAVAEGSHANYPQAKQKRSPDWAHCQGAPAGATTLLGYASDIRDKTEYGWQWYPSAGGWRPADAETFPMSFPGYWGADESTTLVGFFKSSRLGEGHGPRTPTQQPLWESPVKKIFCGNYTGPKGNYECREE